MAAAADVEGVEIAEGEAVAVDGDCSESSDVEDAEFAALGEEIGFEGWVGFEGERVSDGDCGSDDGAVQVNVGKVDFAGLEEIGKEKGTAQLLKWSWF